MRAEVENLSSSEDIVQLADMFRLMGDASRLSIILVCLKGPTSVGDIAQRLGLSASLVSHHLRLLRAARVLRAERRGKQMFYCAADDHIECVIGDMVAHIGEPTEETD
ncbi:MAG: metalloregulator ArsR/SmtB family transcription factor [Pseudomonadales bacterium]|jgi:DNA-binding transcriptional ArsR family regulator|nr:metalloregulator ArsR/SmtB family transcription factor [Pseudomonadales bacterium]MDP6470969.1 metalloregulator ArsR/SmtB family transcription factor [Pseudomonadales bacterium]MDP6825846.1 metalloregulator ArsR/SmtB family transcription factor [Pseudomonadales bacterium]MDP6972813.1 metalloregulator ArsR/SmtB family transcription factor [Pseudomonadales bacterium]|tara:strand:+ start:5643 stop:5966 length:324 start_codon:yes stop_codon:yes gene_type:complete